MQHHSVILSHDLQVVWDPTLQPWCFVKKRDRESRYCDDIGEGANMAVALAELWLAMSFWWRVSCHVLVLRSRADLKILTLIKRCFLLKTVHIYLHQRWSKTGKELCLKSRTSSRQNPSDGSGLRPNSPCVERRVQREYLLHGYPDVDHDNDEDVSAIMGQTHVEINNKKFTKAKHDVILLTRTMTIFCWQW